MWRVWLGSQTFRPHYHGIYFGLNLPDVVNKPGNVLSECGEPVLESDILSSIWKKGFAELGSVTPASCSYVARYVTKKAQSDDRALQESLGIEPEFNLMSRRKAIGREFFDKHPQMFDTGKFFLGTEKGSVKIYPSRYFRNLKDLPDNKIDRYVSGKLRRKSADTLSDIKYSDRLLISESNKKDQIKILTNREI